MIYRHLLVLCVATVVYGQEDEFEFTPLSLAKGFIDGNMKKIKSVTDRYKVNDTHSAECYDGFVNLRNGFERGEIWAIKVLDSWSKMQSGILSGNIVDEGNYDECVNINEVRGNITIYQGQYCITPLIPDGNTTINMDTTSMVDDVKFASKFNFGFTVCIPATCPPRLWKAIVNELLKGYVTVYEEVGQNIELNCDKVGVKSVFTTLDWIGVAFFGTTLLLLIVSTIYDYIVKEPIKILTAFSLYSNGKHIFNLKPSKSRDNIQCLHGIRSLGIIGVIVGHSYLLQGQVPSVNKIVILKWFHQYDKIFMFFVVFHSTHLFLFLSGFLIGWIAFKHLDRLNDTNGLRIVPFMYLKRYLRLTPALGATILLILTFSRLLGDGPKFNFTQKLYADSCQKSWWTTLLYVQNIYHPKFQCPELGGWYLGADTQMFFLSPLIFLPLWKFGKKALLLPIGIFFLTMANSGYQVWLTKLTFLQLFHQDKRNDYMEQIYYQTHHRCSSWLVGIMLSKIIFDWRSKQLDLTKFHFNKIMWTLSFALASGVYFILFKIISERTPISTIVSTIHYLLFHYFLILIVAWIVFASYFGYGGVFNKVLSWKIWLPVSRLTYSMYLSHSFVMLPAQFRSHAPMYIDTFLCFLTALQAVVSTFLVAIPFNIAFETSYGHIFNCITGIDGKLNHLAENESNKDDGRVNQLPLTNTREKRNKIYFNQ